MGTSLAMSAACAADKGPDPCPDLPPCIAGSTYNATACECLLDDEVSDASDAENADHASELDASNDAAFDTSAPTPEDAGHAEAAAEAD